MQSGLENLGKKLAGLFLLFVALPTITYSQIYKMDDDKRIQFIDKAHYVSAAMQMEDYLPLLRGKHVGIVGNQTSIIGEMHLVDTLIACGIDVRKIYTPEHGFRGTADAGAKINSGKDEKTGLPIVSLYGKTKKPTPEMLYGIDVILFDFSEDPYHISLDGAVTLANAYPNAALICIHWGTMDAPDRDPFNGDPSPLPALISHPERLYVLAPGEAFALPKAR